jgi:hypothetical protein
MPLITIVVLTTTGAAVAVGWLVYEIGRRTTDEATRQRIASVMMELMTLL